jgi:hypothetical protein
LIPKIRKRLALALCRAAGLHEVASTRAELDDIRAEHRRLSTLYTAQTQLVKTMARQLNSNTVMMKRWLDASPSLQTVEKAAQRKSKLILPPTADLRTNLR